MSLATRDGFGHELVDLGRKNNNILVLSADLSKATRTNAFQENFHERFFECGIAECNAIGIASGLSENGFYPIFSSFASFLTGKYDVIRVSAAYSNSSMLLVGTHSGMAIGKDGVTQMGLEDISLMRSLPNMKVYQPATYNQCREMMKLIVHQSGPSYLRLGRQPIDELFNTEENLTLGKIQEVKVDEQSEICFVSSGCVLNDVLGACEILKLSGYKTTVLNVHTIKPFDKKTLLKHARKNKVFITVEDHSVIGGVGSVVCEVLSENMPKKVTRIGLLDIFPESGDPKDLYVKYKLDSKGIAERVLNDISQ